MFLGNCSATQVQKTVINWLYNNIIFSKNWVWLYSSDDWYTYFLNFVIFIEICTHFQPIFLKLISRNTFCWKLHGKNLRILFGIGFRGASTLWRLPVLLEFWWGSVLWHAEHYREQLWNLGNKCSCCTFYCWADVWDNRIHSIW